jgi:ribosome-associated protein
LWGRTTRRVDERAAGAEIGAVTDSRELARLAARAASSKQGEAIVILDVRELITITDYFVIASGASDRQVDTIADEVLRELKKNETRPVRKEGDPAARWILLDFVDFVVHVFHEEEREYYRLENLWRDAPIVEWDGGAEASSG